jgi:hypothetical protein
VKEKIADDLNEAIFFSLPIIRRKNLNGFFFGPNLFHISQGAVVSLIYYLMIS